MKVLVTGMGGVLGTKVAQMLEARPGINEVVGCDFVPPRRRLHRATFTRIHPEDRDRLTDYVTDFAPDAIAHMGVYEPDARMGPAEAARATETCTVAALGAAARAGNLQRIALRSGLEVYGRGHRHPKMPDERAPLAPTTHYGRMLLEVEAIASDLARREDITVCALRYAIVAGSHAPCPFARMLRLPAVPVPAFADPPFALLDHDDAAHAMVEAIVRAYDGPLNVVGPGASSPWQAVRLGGRLPVPVFGPGWPVARRMVELAGAPLPDHVEEVFHRGRAGDGSLAREVLDLGVMHPTQEVLADVFDWATVTPITDASRASEIA
ncbi:MAG: NAD-dependent epimerase/dehydratase family protein [Actinobacteria bacterium]|nr:NAD-dependent epimerase/dehydratase family protein [Actinomycetota bacterium]